MNLFSRYKINIMNAIFAFIMFFCCLGYVNADLVATIHSTTTGGNWNSASTWQEGRVPTANDVVEINGLVEIPGNITTGSVKINTSGTIRKKFDWGTNNYTLSISGSLENNGVLGGTNNQYHIPFVVNVSGNVLNNGTMNFFNSMSVSGDLRNNNAINNISGINAYGKLLNGPNSNVTGNISIQGSTKEKDLVIETQPNFTPTIYMNGDMTLKTDLDFRGNIYLQNKNLYVDGTKNIYLNIVYGGGKVLSMNGNGDGENLKVSQIHGNAETNIENLEILTHMYGVKGRNIVSKGGYLLNTSTFDKLTLNGYTEIVNTTTLNGNVLVTGSGTLRRIYNTDRVYYTLTV
ncbi:MAG: hypothetical protein Q8K30_00865, partial [Candidatus Gracilibacteria bacterium]|nr:hypothetical protein [Candidatus Gracilibacteria bacterium]